MAEIICNKNRGYRWTKNKGIYFKGYLQAEDGEIWRAEEAIDQLLGIESFEEFRKYLRNIYGVFAIIIEHGSDGLPVMLQALFHCIIQTIPK